MKKKVSLIILLTLFICATFVLCACSSPSDNGKNDETTNPDMTTADTTTADTTTADTATADTTTADTTTADTTTADTTTADTATADTTTADTTTADTTAAETTTAETTTADTTTADTTTADTTTADTTAAETKTETTAPEPEVLEVNRGDFLQMLADFSTDVLKFNLNGYVYTNPIYSDIKSGSGLSRAAVWCGAWKIMDGRANGTFGVDDAITRGEIKNAIIQYVKVWLEDNTFTAEKAEKIVSAVTPTGKDGKYASSDITAILDGVKKYSDETEACNSLYAHMKRGMNIWTWDNSLYGDRVSGANTTLYKELWDAGFDHVRLVWDATNAEDRYDDLFTYSINPKTRLYDIVLKQERFDSVISASNLAEKAGMTAVVDLHGIRFPTNMKDPVNPNEQPRLFIQMWGYFAKNLNSLPDTVMFELCNETFIEGKTVEKTIDAIRETGGNNSTRPIIVYSYHWDVEEDILDIGKYNGDKSIVWDIHNYEPYWFTIGNESTGFDDDGWSIPKYRYNSEVFELMISRMNCGRDLTEKTGQKVWFGEYGTVGAAGADREKYLTTYMDEMLKYGMYSTCYWSLGFYGNEDIFKPYGTKSQLEIGSFETTDENGNPKIYWDMDVMRSIFS